MPVERQHSVNNSKKQLINQLKEQFKRSYYENVDDARQSAKKLNKISELKKNIQQKTFDLDSLKEVTSSTKKEIN